jgi:hypothetical protein
MIQIRVYLDECGFNSPHRSQRSAGLIANAEKQARLGVSTIRATFQGQNPVADEHLLGRRREPAKRNLNGKRKVMYPTRDRAREVHRGASIVRFTKQSDPIKKRLSSDGFSDISSVHSPS